MTDTFDNVFEALEPNTAAAANLAARADLMLAVRERVRGWAVTQDEAARRLGLTRPRLSDLLRGKIDRFSLDALMNIASSAGLRPTIRLEDAA